MVSSDLYANTVAWEQEANQCLINGNYAKAASLYEQAITSEPNNRYYYWQLGLILLLQGQEAEAQTTWLLAIAKGQAEEVELWTQELVEVLDREANYQTGKENYSMAWAIRQHIKEIQPDDINNLLSLIDLSVILENYTEEEFIQLKILPLLQEKLSAEPSLELLLHILKKLLIVAPADKTSIEFAKVCASYVKEPQDLINILLPVVYNIAYSYENRKVAIDYLQIPLSLVPEHHELLRTIAQFYVDITEFTKGIEYAKQCYSITTELCDQISDNHAIIRAIMCARGYDEEVQGLIERQKFLLETLIGEKPDNLGTSASLTRLYSSSFFFPYVRDIPKENVRLRHQVAQVCQINIEKSNQQSLDKCRQRLSVAKIRAAPKKNLKIGYLSHCLKRHSVGWIARWLFEYHDRNKFKLYAYLLAADNRQDPLQDWYTDRADRFYKYDIIGGGVAEQICEDEIDILIDLDSVTLTNTCKIMALKPAPVQVTWLGWDASGIPTVDYYIADPYVLPENAQEYYSEKIWRLPQTYVAVNGFEVGLPSLHRDELDIPGDAVIYLSVQKGPKYNPQMLRLQMRILRNVPKSYFLIKGFGNEDFLNDFIIDVAAEEGVARERLRFIDRVGFEETHRANLAIADIVLDTYPYNGATTTLETLWMGIPMVTRVGEQFAARNSYTMMVNAGITEGIAWSDDEYLQWGIKLGRDENLRKQISWKLRKSRQTAPLWNAKQFTREMENAYQQMWQKYVDGD
ncbi:MAG: O-linked N-acetylglucosamine transferase, SPINDLY family protein [Okeania sp. SIO3B5]|uniref:O-linked N-acetylglucosamine transferase, SPINDLY family protein n=1 Tax=Okeania sp. SIO3B5 TaxID=2607811 RepID=UPI0013FEEA42|nr:O-linked N-acetylglucosamine transferase, SPINDLY family protein [Okeania sp. SIO3B5]NEO57872.1 O-linked N-acetylglucosamine transferase, SPINDLY family protein [Okeania sp. SIO3B5]